MGLQWVLDFFRKVAPETLDHLERDEGVSMEDYAAVIRDRRAVLMERDVYKRLLIQGGETEKTLAARVALHKRTLLNSVKAGAA